jgi:hypothetical protein
VNHVFWREKYPIFTDNWVSADFGWGIADSGFSPPNPKNSLARRRSVKKYPGENEFPWGRQLA